MCPLADPGFPNQPLAFCPTLPGHVLWYVQPKVDRLQRVFQRTQDALRPPCSSYLLRSLAQIIAQFDIVPLILCIVGGVLERLGSSPLRCVVLHQAVVRTHPLRLSIGEVEVPGEPRQRLAQLVPCYSQEREELVKTLRAQTLGIEGLGVRALVLHLQLRLGAELNQTQTAKACESNRTVLLFRDRDIQKG
eukprot:7387506-Prymnesium_polylepis.2